MVQRSAPRLFESFTVIPSIDLKDGAVVRLMRGDMRKATVYGDDPAAIAREFEAAGTTMIHVVDLDGAITGEPRNLAAMRAVRSAVRCALDFSGGLRSLGSIRDAFDAGADRIALGSAAFLDPGLLDEACRQFQGRVFGSIDAREDRLAIKGWVETSSLSVADAAARFRDAGVEALIYTDIARDGTQEGADVAKFAALARDARVKVIASGGVATLDDIRALRRHFHDGVGGVIAGRALYEHLFTLAQALEAAR
jgi:phosphoribosylformimino-5-aminoimidazole carboxamide ribotide isomerase